MLASLLTTLSFALAGVTNQRVAVTLGAQWGNFIRLLIACAILAIITLGWMRESLQLEVFSWFFLSGLIGFGVGDVALFAAFSRIGSRLTVLLTLCLAPIFALLVEWIWLGGLPSMQTLGCMFVILVGVGLSISGNLKSAASTKASLPIVGILAAMIAGLGQGVGAVISRKAELIAQDQGVFVSGVSAAFQRVFAGVLFGAVVVVVLRWGVKKIAIPSVSEHLKVNGWLLGAALFGPVLGVSCFQWALQSLESSVVLAITALTPIVLMPMAVITEKDRPSVSAVIGAFIAVTGVVLVYLWCV